MYKTQTLRCPISTNTVGEKKTAVVRGLKKSSAYSLVEKSLSHRYGCKVSNNILIGKKNKEKK